MIWTQTLYCHFLSGLKHIIKLPWAFHVCAEYSKLYTWNIYYIVNTLIFKIILLLFKYSCLHLPPTRHPHPNHPHLPPLIPRPPWFCPCVLYSSSWKPFRTFPHYPLPLPLWLLWVCSLFQCLWFYCSCLFVLLIRFHLKVGSYGLSLLPAALFHLA